MSVQIHHQQTRQKLLGKVQDYPYHNSNLLNKNLLITGATQGIGKLLALLAGKAQAQLILLDKSVPALESLSADLAQLTDKLPICLPINLLGATPDDYSDMADKLASVCPQVDGLIHNAAYFSGLYPMQQMPVKEWLNQLQVNLNAPMWLTQALFPLLLQAPSPSILFADHLEVRVADVAYWNSYAVSKAALMQTMQLWALENAVNQPHLRLYGYNTGWVDTQLSRDAYPNGHEAALLSDDLSLAERILALFEQMYPSGEIIQLGS